MRAVRLPDSADTEHIQGKYENGVLTLKARAWRAAGHAVMLSCVQVSAYSACQTVPREQGLAFKLQSPLTTVL